MQNILLDVSYDGTDFCGWQRQDKSAGGQPVRTVQGEIEKALEKMFRQHIDLQGSGRTDSGVHARCQKANFFSPVDDIPGKNYCRGLNTFLPQDIRITNARLVPDDFSSRFSATSRTYRYFIMCDSVPLANESRFVWCIPKVPDIDTLNAMALHLRGEIDCATFTAAGDQSVSTCRYLDDAHFYWQESNGTESRKLVFQIQANAFLWKMVRSITGTLIHAEAKGLGEKDFREILESRDRSRALMTAPATGLFLWDVAFDGIRRHV